MARLRTTSIIACSGLMLCLLAEEPTLAQPVVLTQKGEETARTIETQDLDILQADAFIREVFSSLDVAQYDAAARAFLWLLAQVDRPLSAPEQAVVLKHLRSVAMILPASERAALNLDDTLVQGELSRLPPGSGARLARWWRSQDTLPATEDNERLEEHLTRVMLAIQQYGSAEDDRGFDDRGEIYVRLGAPSHHTSVEIRDSQLLMHPFVSQLPANAFWVYRHINHDAYYLFIQRTPNEPFELGYSTDLIPSDLRSGTRKTALLLHVMEEIFGQLALQHINFGTYYDEVANYRALPSRDAGPPERFALRTFSHAFAEDQQHEWNRAETVPPSYSGTYGQAERLTVPMRWARFLDPDGTTRTEIYWSLETRALKPSRRLVRRLKKQGYSPSDVYLLSLAVAQQTTDFQYRSINKKHYLVSTNAEGDLPVKALVVRGDTATYTLALQWDQQWTRANEEQPDALLPGATLKIGVERLDTLQALHNQEHRLEMSDLKPLRRSGEKTLETDPPYPHTHLTPATPLALYFELYHLAYGRDDQTHYTIQYEVARSQKKGGLLRLSGHRDVERTTSETTYTGNSRTAPEYIALDLSAWQGPGNLDITVRTTDETTGAQVARTITFTLE